MKTAGQTAFLVVWPVLFSREMCKKCANFFLNPVGSFLKTKKAAKGEKTAFF